MLTLFSEKIGNGFQLFPLPRARCKELARNAERPRTAERPVTPRRAAEPRTVQKEQKKHTCTIGGARFLACSRYRQQEMPCYQHKRQHLFFGKIHVQGDKLILLAASFDLKYLKIAFLCILKRLQCVICLYHIIIHQLLKMR